MRKIPFLRTSKNKLVLISEGGYQGTNVPRGLAKNTS